MRNRRDLLVLNCDNSGNLCIFFALLLAYFARSILAKVFFGNITLPIFYVLAYGSILIALRLRVRRMNSYLPWLLAIGAVILFGMFRTGDFSPLYGYLIVILLPLTVPDSAGKQRAKTHPNAIKVVTVRIKVIHFLDRTALSGTVSGRSITIR